MKSILLLCIPLCLGILVSCVEQKDENDYLIQVFGKSYICESADFTGSGAYLYGCKNVMDAKDTIDEIYSATNFIKVNDLI